MKIREAILLADILHSDEEDPKMQVPLAMKSIGEFPLLECYLKYLIRFDVEHVIIAAASEWESISEYFGSSYKSLRITYAITKVPFNSGGAIRQTLEKIENEHAIVIDSSHFFQVNLHDLSEFYFAHKADICMTVKRKKDFFRFETIELDVCKVIGINNEKPTNRRLIDGRVYALSKNIFNRFELPENFHFVQDFLKPHLKELKTCAMRSDEEFFDISFPADIEKVKMLYAQGN